MRMATIRSGEVTCGLAVGEQPTARALDYSMRSRATSPVVPSWNVWGTQFNFQQVLSVRQNPRQCGHVSISEHFRQWGRMGINLGLMKEAKVLVEAGGGNGSITFTHANVTVTPPE
jgi:hypothetical protein